MDNCKIGSSDLHSKIAGLCVCIRDKVPYLTATCDPFFNDHTTQTVEYGKTLSSQIVQWLNDTNSVIIEETISLRHELLPKEHNEPKHSNELMIRPTLVTMNTDISSLVVQVILWACISEDCNNAIIDSLLGKTLTVQQQDILPTNDQLQMWIRRFCFCVKKAVSKSFLTLSKTAETSSLSFLTSSVLFESCIIGHIVERSAHLFSILGKVPEPLYFLTSDPLNKPAIDAMQANKTKNPGVMKDTLSLVSFLYQHHIQALSELSVKKVNEGLSRNKGLAILPFIPYDILSFMLKYEEIESKWNVLLDLPGNDKVHNNYSGSEVINAELQIIKSDLEKMYDLIKMKLIDPTMGNERRQDKIVNEKAKHLFSADYLKENDLIEVQIMILHNCVKSLRTIIKSKKQKLTVGENTLVNVIFTAINHVPDFVDNIEGLFNHLGTTLFKPAFMAYMVDVKFKIPAGNDDAVWHIYFPSMTRSEIVQSQNTKSKKSNNNFEPALHTKRKSRKELHCIQKEAIGLKIVRSAQDSQSQKFPNPTGTNKSTRIPINIKQNAQSRTKQQGKGRGQEKKQVVGKVNADAGNTSLMKHRSTPPELFRKKETAEAQDKAQKVGRLGGGRRREKNVRDSVSQINVHSKRPAEVPPPQDTIRKKRKSWKEVEDKKRNRWFKRSMQILDTQHL